VSVDDLLSSTPFNEAESTNARLILDKFRAAGLSSGIALAAVVNAWAESMLDPLVCFGRTPWGADRAFGPIGGEENSCGLFQLNGAVGAAGEGMSVEARQDPVLNTDRIIQIVKGPSGAALRSASADAAPLGRLIYIFTTDIERPADSNTKGNDRSEIAREWWPGLVDEPSSKLPQFTGGSSSPFFLLALAGVLVAILVLKR